MQKTITIPDDKVNLFVEAFSQDYDPTLPDGTPNPETRAQYAWQMVLIQIRQRVWKYQRAQIMAAAETQAGALEEINIT